MHEFSICQSLVDIAVSEMARIRPPPKRLVKARVVIGALHQIVPGSLLMAYEVLTRDTPAHGSELEILPVPVTVRCGACGWQGAVEPPMFLCGSCNSGEIEFVTGKELYLENLEVEQDDDDQH